jgi:hypothetical protein
MSDKPMIAVGYGDKKKTNKKFVKLLDARKGDAYITRRLERLGLLEDESS